MNFLRTKDTDLMNKLRKTKQNPIKGLYIIDPDLILGDVFILLGIMPYHTFYVLHILVSLKCDSQKETRDVSNTVSVTNECFRQRFFDFLLLLSVIDSVK